MWVWQGFQWIPFNVPLLLCPSYYAGLAQAQIQQKTKNQYQMYFRTDIWCLFDVVLLWL